MLNLEMETDLRQQHKEFLKEGYNGHNRHSGIITIGDLKNRRYRREWNRWMRETVISLNNNGSLISYLRK